MTRNCNDSALSDLRTEPPLIAKAAERSVLGCMNEVAFPCEDAVADAGGLAPMDLESLNHCLRWNVNGAPGYERLIDLVIARATR
jgi:hypothetical protein